MPRKVLKASTGSQMTNPTSGTGSGLDRCTEMTASMILKTYSAGPWASLSTYAMMLKLTEMLNNGRDSSVPENMGVWFPAFMKKYSITSFTLKNTVWPGFSTVVDCIDRGHVAIGGFNNYAALRLSNGQNPYKWTDPPNLGHVLLIVGYDLEQQHVIVHDPLRADPSGQPADYSWKSFQNAVFHDCTEVVGAALPYTVNTAAAPEPAPAPPPAPTPTTGGTSMTAPANWHDNEATATLTAPNGMVVVKGFRDYILAHSWDAGNLPQAAERVVGSVSPADATLGAGSRQDFLYSSLGWTSVHGVFQIALAHELTLANNAAQTAAADNQTLQATLKQQAAQIAALQATAPVSPAAIDSAAAALQTAIVAYQTARSKSMGSITSPLPAAPAAAN